MPTETTSFSARRILSLCCGILAPLLMTTAQAQSWVATGTKALPLQNATVVGPLDPNASVHVVVALKLQNMDQLKTTIVRANTPGDSMYGTTLTPADFTATYGPTTAQVPASLGGTVLSVPGLNNIQAMQTPLARRTTSTPSIPDVNRSIYGPQDFQIAYDSSDSATSSWAVTEGTWPLPAGTIPPVSVRMTYPSSLSSSSK